MLRRRTVRAAAILATLALAATAWYLGSPLFIRTTLDEPLPGGAVTGTSAPASSPIGTAGASAAASAAATRTTQTTVQFRGQLQYVDALHNGTGTVLGMVIASCCPVSDQYLLRFEDVAITNAPDVHVYLSPERGGRWSEATSKYLGPLKATNGSFNYVIAPSDLGIYRSVVVWCRAFAVLVTWADLDRA